MIPRRRRLGAWRLALTCCLAVSVLCPQEAPKRSAFEGLVRDSITNQQLPKASIHLLPTAPDKPAYAGATGPDGKFRFESVEPGSYRIEVTKSGYRQAITVSLKPGTTTTALRFSNGEPVTGAEIALDPRAVITGRVTDAAGDPIPFATIRAAVEHWQRGSRVYLSSDSAESDDRGEYRIALDAGRYFLSAASSPATFAEAPDAAEMQIGAMIYPNSTTIASAAPIVLQSGQQLTGIDFRLTPAKNYHIRGSVKPVFSWDKTYVAPQRRDGDRFSRGPLSVIEKDGSFDLDRLGPGNYWLQLWPLHGPRPTGRVHVTVTDKDLKDVVLPAMSPFELKGHIKWEDSETGEALSPVKLHIDELDWSEFFVNRDFSTAAEGAFVVPNLSCAEYVITLPPDRDLYIKSISYAGGAEIEAARLDLTKGAAGELEIVLGSGTGQVQGVVRWPDATRHDVKAVLVSTEGRTGNTRARSADIDSNGVFQFHFVPPGRYGVFAVSSYDPGLWQNMEFVNEIESRSVPVELSRKASAQVEVPTLSREEMERAIDRIAK